MATVINKAAGTIAEKYGSAVSKVTSRVTTGPLQKGWRARILTNRALSGLPKNGSLTPNFTKTIDSITSGSIVGDLVSQTTGIKPGPNANIIAQRRIQDTNSVDQGSIGTKRYRNYTNNGENTRRIDSTQASMKPVISYIESKEQWLELYSEGIVKTNKVIIFNNCTSPYRYIELQNRPTSIDFRGESTWAVIKSMGRNTPMYHYTSSEDIYQMNVSWYCNDPDNPGEVINKCRLLESWTKSDGYTLAPPVLQIGWGTDGDLFYGKYFILTSATYTLGNFNAAARMRNLGTGETIATQQKYLLPYVATQELIFKRVSDHNSTHAEITTLGMGNRFTLQQTKGITYQNSKIGYLRT